MLYRTIKNTKDQSINNEVFTMPVSPAARALLGYMLSKPADWTFFNSQIEVEFGVNSSMLRRLLKELKDYGVVRRYRQHIDGKWQWRTDVFESLELASSAQNSTDSKSTDSKSTDSKHTDILNTDIQLSTDINKVLNNTMGVGSFKQITQELNQLLGNTGKLKADYSRKLKARLKTFTLEEIKTAAKNIAANEFMLTNRHNKIEYLLRSDQVIDKWQDTEPKKKVMY